ncbi:MAG: hypothetical protein NVSMB32_15020 [Actinomycetota bacterium]
MDALSECLLGMGPRDRRRLPGMDRHRADVLGVGAMVIAATLRHVGLSGLTVSEWGLREGVILEALALAHIGAPSAWRLPSLNRPLAQPAV